MQTLAAFLGYTFLPCLWCSYTTFNEKKKICCLLQALEELISWTLYLSLTRLSFIKPVQHVTSQSLPGKAQQESCLTETLDPIKALKPCLLFGDFPKNSQHSRCTTFPSLWLLYTVEFSFNANLDTLKPARLLLTRQHRILDTLKPARLLLTRALQAPSTELPNFEFRSSQVSVKGEHRLRGVWRDISARKGN